MILDIFIHGGDGLIACKSTSVYICYDNVHISVNCLLVQDNQRAQTPDQTNNNIENNLEDCLMHTPQCKVPEPQIEHWYIWMIFGWF